MVLEVTATSWYRISDEEKKELGFRNEEEPIYKEFKTIEELETFIAMYGVCCISKDTIEIYNNYRE